MIRCTATRKAASSMATMIATATCRSTSSAAGTCWRPSCAARTPMARPARWKRLPASWRRSAAAGRGHAFCCAAIPASPATPLMAWCEANRVDYVFGLARNDRLEKAIVAELITATIDSIRTGKTARCFKDFTLRHAGQLEPRTPRHRQGRGHRRRGQSALYRHLAEAQRGGCAASLREDLLRARRHGEPHQGVPARPVRRPHLDGDHAGQPASPVVRLHGLRAAVRTCAASAWRTRSSPRRPAARSG